MKRAVAVLVAFTLVASAFGDEPDHKSALEGALREYDLAITQARPLIWIAAAGIIVSVAGTGLAVYGNPDGVEVFADTPALGKAGIFVSVTGMLVAVVAGGRRIFHPQIKAADRRVRYAQLAVAREQRQAGLDERYTEREVGAIMARTVYVGMSREALIESWGSPDDINRTVTSGMSREQMVYPGGQYVYVENGTVTGWQD